MEALQSLGIAPWLKYDGDRGFDLIVPLEAIPYEAWLGDLLLLNEIHHQLTEFIASYLDEHFFKLEEKCPRSSFRVEGDAGACLLSELRVRRGLLLAPMSLNPKTDLISVPISLEQLDDFTILDATKERAHPAEWRFPQAPVYSLVRFAPAQSLAHAEGAEV
jgi:hypothetical protein